MQDDARHTTLLQSTAAASFSTATSTAAGDVLDYQICTAAKLTAQRAADASAHAHLISSKLYCIRVVCGAH
jgi:hypothetical protein